MHQKVLSSSTAHAPKGAIGPKGLKVLDAAASAYTNCWWWIKADGVDVVAGLGESLRLQWSGDVDLCDGELQTQYQLYRNRLAFVQALASTSSRLLDENLHRELAEDLTYVISMSYI